MSSWCDQPTSYDGDFRGARWLTVRHEVWRYTNRYGRWVRTGGRESGPDSHGHEFGSGTWVWEPGLGGIEGEPEAVGSLWNYTRPVRPADRRAGSQVKGAVRFNHGTPVQPFVSSVCWAYRSASAPVNLIVLAC